MRKILGMSLLPLMAIVILSGCSSPAEVPTTGPGGVNTPLSTIAAAPTLLPEPSPTAAAPTNVPASPSAGATSAATRAATPAPSAAPTGGTSSAGTKTPTASGTTATSCNRVTFVADVTVPDRTALAANQSFNKIWRVRNSGTCTWGSGYTLTFVRGQAMAKDTVVTIPNTAPGATVDILVPMVAPSTAGRHTSYWRLRAPDGTSFGSEIWTTVNVIAGLPTGGNQNQGTPIPNATATP